MFWGGYRKNERTRRIADELAFRYVDPVHDVYPLTGPKNSIYIADTDRCFHYDSRAGRRPRRLLAIHYYSPFAFVLPRNWMKALPLARLADRPEVADTDRMVLGAR